MNAFKPSIVFVSSAILFSTAVSAQTVHRYQAGFAKYAEVQAVSGRESRFIEFIKGQLPAGLKSETDNMGNLTVQIGSQAPKLLVLTSVDEPGYVVTDITEDGYLRVESPAGRGASTLFHQFHEGHYVDISTSTGTVRGVVSIPSSHIFRGRRENLTADRFLIDIGARSRNDALARGVQVLDPVAAIKDVAMLAQNRIAGPMLSRKFGAFAMIEALKLCDPKQSRGVVFAWTTQSALRNSGLTRLIRKYSPEQVLVVGAFRRSEDRRTRAVRNPVDALDSGVLIPDTDAGPLLRAASSAAPGLSIKLTASPVGALPEVRSFGQTQVDILPVAIAVKYPDTLVETVDLDDLAQLVQFVRLIADSGPHISD